MTGSREREHSACVGCVVEMHRRRGGRKQLKWAKLWKGEIRQSTHPATEWGAWLACRKRDREREWANKHSACACYAGMAKRRESLKAAVFGQKVAEEKIGRSGWRNRGRALHSWFCLFSLPGAPPISTKLVCLHKTGFLVENSFLISQQTCFVFSKQLFWGKKWLKRRLADQDGGTGVELSFPGFPFSPFLQSRVANL